MARFITIAAVLAAMTVSALASPSAHKEERATPGKAKTLPFTAKVGSGKLGVSNIAAADRARIAHIKSDAALRKAGVKGGAFGSKKGKKSRAEFSVAATNAAVTYTAPVVVGGGVTRDLLIDTGSSNTWIGFLQEYDGTDCSGEFEVSYGSGFVFGEECFDEVRLSDDLVIANQSFGVAEFGDGFSQDGILGIGPVDLTEGTTSDFDTVPTVTDNLFAQGTIDVESIGVFYAPTTEESVTNGELTFGGADESKLSKSIAYTPLTTTEPATFYWGVDQTVAYGDSEILPLSAGIVDTGTTLVYLATDAYDKYVAATGAVYDDQSTGLLAITEAQFEALQPLTFNIGSAGSYSLSPNAQIWPRALNEAIGGNSSAIYLVVADFGSPSGEGLDFIDGYTFLERYYTVYDTTNGQFGIAPTEFTDATTN